MLYKHEHHQSPNQLLRSLLNTLETIPTMQDPIVADEGFEMGFRSKTNKHLYEYSSKSKGIATTTTHYIDYILLL
jgi:hypothetical protein